MVVARVSARLVARVSARVPAFDGPTAHDSRAQGEGEDGVDDELTVDLHTAAQRLHIGAEWLARQARAGTVPHVRLGRSRRFTEENLQAILSQFQQPVAPAPVPVSVDPWARPSRARRRAS